MQNIKEKCNKETETLPWFEASQGKMFVRPHLSQWLVVLYCTSYSEKQEDHDLLSKSRVFAWQAQEWSFNP
jgi:hypothetical protein